MVVLAGSLLAADSRDEVKSAARKLAEKDNYSWKTTVETGGNFRPGPSEGKTEKDGYTVLSMSFRDNTTEAVMKGDKGAIKTPDEGWKSLAEAAADDGGGQPNPGRFIARMLRNFKVPAAQAEDLAGKVKDLKSADGVYSGDLTEEGAKLLLTFGPPAAETHPRSAVPKAPSNSGSKMENSPKSNSMCRGNYRLTATTGTWTGRPLSRSKMSARPR